MLKAIIFLMLFGSLITGASGLKLSVSSNGVGTSDSYAFKPLDNLEQKITLSPMASTVKDSGSGKGYGDMAPVIQSLYGGPGSVHMYAAVNGNGKTGSGRTEWKYSWYTERVPGTSVKASFTWNYVKNANSLFAYADAWNTKEDQSYSSIYAEGKGNIYAALSNYHVESKATGTTAIAKQTLPSATGSRIVLNNFGRNGDGSVSGITDINTGTINAYSATVNCYSALDSANSIKRVDVNAASITATSGTIDQILLAQKSDGTFSKVETYIKRGKLYSYPYRKSDYPAYALFSSLIGGGTVASQSEQMTGTYVRGSAFANPGFGTVYQNSIESSSSKKAIKIGNFARTGAINPVGYVLISKKLA